MLLQVLAHLCAELCLSRHAGGNYAAHRHMMYRTALGVVSHIGLTVATLLATVTCTVVTREVPLRHRSHWREARRTRQHLWTCMLGS